MPEASASLDLLEFHGWLTRQSERQQALRLHGPAR